MSSIDEIVRLSGEIGLTRIAITDHSQAMLDRTGMPKKSFRSGLDRWKNPWNGVDVAFGVEADLLDEDGRFCAEIDGRSSPFLILSYHREIYEGDRGKIVRGFKKAMDSRRFSLIGHVCVDVEEEVAAAIIDEANEREIPLELNATYYLKESSRWDVLFERADRAYLNSDAHNLYELKHQRRMALELMARSGRA
jgi:histidinol phosphatase-like PHP family hydrolase